MTTKNQYWQIVRAVCILAVVMIHCPSPTNNIDTWLIIRQFINFPVAVFIFLSGYFVNPDKADFNWIKNRWGWRLFLPYVIWSVFFTILDIVRNGINVKHIIYGLLVGKAAAPFYYIIVLLQLLVITPWLVKHRKKWMYLITPAYLVLLYVYNVLTGNMPRLYETVFIAWLGFYLLGMDCRAGKLDWIIQRAKSWWIVAAITVSIVEAYFLLNIGCSSGFACSQIKFSSFAYAMIVALWLCKNEKNVQSGLLTKIGDYSYGIFFCHMFFMMIVTKLLKIVGMDNIWIVYWLLSFAGTSILSIITVGMTRQIIKDKKVLRAIGFD